MTDLDAIYSREWYEADYGSPEVRRDWEIVAAGLDRWALSRFSGATALDVGCGPGLLVAGLRDLGWQAYGFDGSRHAIEYARRLVPNVFPHIWQGDIWGLGHPVVGKCNLVTCTEVAEHIEPDLAPALVRALVRRAREAIVFTAAAVGQGGHHHINEQPREYWLDLFAEHGWIEDEASRHELRCRWAKVERCWWIPKNVMVLR